MYRPHASNLSEIVILLPNNQRQHRTSHAPKDVLPLRICASYCAPCQPQTSREQASAALDGRVLHGPAMLTLPSHRERESSVLTAY